MVNPSDESARARFATEIDRNFSVIASAGSGKTTAITRRILEIARSSSAETILPRLVVVTFANRAADEMQQQARQLLLEEKKLEPAVQTAFNRAFFGTIHSFCMKLLAEFGHYLGLPAPLELVEDDADLWREFVQSHARVGTSLGEKNRRRLLRHVQTRDLMELARRAGSAALCLPDETAPPPLDLSAIYAVASRNNENISQSQAELRDWEERYHAGWEYLRWPVNYTAANSKFAEVWTNAFSPLRHWISNSAMCVAAEVQRDYREFRLERGLVTYGDQIALAKELLDHPVAGPRIREQDFRVILDEAQDTEPAQFSVLVETARPPFASGPWLDVRTDPPRPGYFCMVGDFQQSIYHDRADLPHYKAVHDALVGEGAGEALKFSVTFRLDEKQLQFVNETFREILNGCNDQVQFVELQPRPDVLPGKVIRIPLRGEELLPPGRKLKEYQKARIEADFLAHWIRKTGRKALSADSWRDVAILCPRKAWLQTLAAALRRVGLPVSIQSERDVKGDSPAYAWFAALITIMAEPRNTYEVVGVLREVFGLSDHDLAVYSEGHGTRFRIDQMKAATGKISSSLRRLTKIREDIEGLALFDATRLIVEETHLRERLGLLPETEFGDLEKELDTLLAQAAEAESERMILSEFAQFLRDDFKSPRAVRFSDQDAIQLITSHKAKGSEWQAVIIPFLARDLRPPSPPYPHFVKLPKTGDFVIALGREDKSKELKDAVERAQMQELERLLYVATTRARHTLAIVLDQEIFCTSERKLPKTAQLRRLIRGRDTYEGEFDGNTIVIPASLERPDVPSPEETPSPTLRADEAMLKRARANAMRFVRKVTPSGLEPAGTEELETKRPIDSPALLYGRWWHGFFERIDWRAGASGAQAVFDGVLPLAPESDRARVDWSLTKQALFLDPLLAEYLGRNQTRFHREFPFAWQMNQNIVLEGLIDLLMVDAQAGRCLLVDWKTNRVAPCEAEELRGRYRPQLAGYWKAISELTGLQISAALVSTALGRVLPYQPAELQEEWVRLQKFPPLKLQKELRPDGPEDF